MTEEIDITKTITVWARVDDKSEWEGPFKSTGWLAGGKHVVYDDKGSWFVYGDVTPIDPTIKAKPDYLNEGEELWPYMGQGKYDTPNSIFTNYSDLMDNYLDRIVGFALATGDGSVFVCSSPVVYTHKYASDVYLCRYNDYQDNAKLLGVVMRSK